MGVQQRKKAPTKAATTKSSPKEAKKVVEGPYTDYKLQVLLVAAMVLPWISMHFALEKSVEEMVQELTVSNWRETKFLQDESFWKLIGCLSTPHVFYLIVWTNSQTFSKIVNALGLVKLFGEPFQVFAKMAHAIKFFQTCCILLWFVGLDTLKDPSIIDKTKDLVLSINPSQLLLGAELFLLGQLFNGAVYSTIGEAGVYYGCRLGKDIPWVYGFPFSVVPHPQYLGATISIWGGYFLFASESTVEQGLLAVCGAMTIFYAFSSYVEQYL